jgi:hypothetical protein
MFDDTATPDDCADDGSGAREHPITVAIKQRRSTDR